MGNNSTFGRPSGGDIGKPLKHIELEPLEAPARREAPVPAPAPAPAPRPAPTEPVPA